MSDVFLASFLWQLQHPWVYWGKWSSIVSPSRSAKSEQYQTYSKQITMIADLEHLYHSKRSQFFTLVKLQLLLIIFHLLKLFLIFYRGKLWVFGNILLWFHLFRVASEVRRCFWIYLSCCTFWEFFQSLFLFRWFHWLWKWRLRGFVSYS